MKVRGDKTLSQITEDSMLHHALDEESNSIATIVRHLSGNMISRWTNFFEEDGEKVNRDRPSEFYVDYTPSKDELLMRWEKGWEVFFNTLDSITVDDLERTVRIRGEEHTVLEALNRQLAHYSEHMGQMIFLVKHFNSSNWKTLSLPRTKRTAFE